jgi:SAM-dependent methyltransferase
MTALVDFTQWGKRIPKRKIVVRDDFYLQTCRSRDVVHLGACDSPFAEGRMRKGELLHQKLRGAGCAKLIGLDYDIPSITYLRDKHGIDDIQQPDLSDRDPSLTPLGDLILCGDIIEHVNNVGNLMYNCNRLCREGGTILVSTINATSIKLAFRAFAGREAVHPDHVAYYSMSTLGVILSRWGWEMEDVRFFPYPTVGKLSGLFFGAIYGMSPQSADGVIAIARKVRNLE